MKIEIQTETRFNRGSRIYYLHIDEETKKYRAKVSFVNKIIIEPLDLRDIETGGWQYKLYYMTSNGKLIPEKDCFKSEADLWERYKDSPSVQKNM